MLYVIAMTYKILIPAFPKLWKMFTLANQNQTLISLHQCHMCIMASDITSNLGNGLFVQQLQGIPALCVHWGAL